MKLSFYDKRDEKQRKLMCDMDLKVIFFTPKAPKKLDKKRKKRKKKILNEDSKKEKELLKDFPFVRRPFMVGESNEKCVFLSPLEIFATPSSTDGLARARVLCTIENGLVMHPWIIGSGDHLNTDHLMSSLNQFIHLLVRNTKEFQVLRDLKVDRKCQVTVFRRKMKYLKYVEVGGFNIVLKGLRKIEKAKKTCLDLSSVPFAFEASVSIEQMGASCVEGILGVCPTFLRSSL